ncbi:MAG TPA: pseudouridine synthase [Candidatus Kapabacteria bacterium]|nr:pseudouridine synthase [Candidatus Kapabacteria bacterium]
MPTPLRKGPKKASSTMRPIRKSSARPSRPLRPKGPRAKPSEDRPRLRGSKDSPLKGSRPLVVKKSDRPAGARDRSPSPRDRSSSPRDRSAARERPSIKRPVRRSIRTTDSHERAGRTSRPASLERKKYPPRKAGAHDRSSAPIKLTKKISMGTRIPISKAARLPIKRIGLPVKKADGLPIKKIALPLKKVTASSEVAPENKELRETVRLNKYIANAGITSRRKADELITQGAVTINGKVVTELGVQVKPYEDQVSVNGEVVSPRPRLVYLLLNKPKDTITTTSDEKDRTTVLDYVQTSERVYPVGRLDRNTTGVLLLTNDGELTNRLTHPSFEIEREYHATLDKRLEHVDARKIAEGGIDIGEGDVTGPAELLTMEIPNEVMLKIREGKNREVRRIFETLGYEVEKLDRTSFAGLTHRGMSRGESRPLTNPEIHRLKALAGIET